MADPIIRLKRSAVAGKRPTLANLPLGEVALNTYDGRLFVRQDTGGVGIATTIRAVNPWSENFISGGEHSIYYDGGDVGIGTQNPTSTLDVNGTVTATSFVGNGSSITGITFEQLSDVTFTNLGQHDIAVYHDGVGWLNDPGASRVVQEVRNVTGIAITQAYPVYETGYNQGNERVTVDVADAGISTAMPALGIIHDADLGNNSNGYVIISGIADGIDTSGYTEGDELYVAVGGGLTNTRPTGATSLIQKIGTVLRSHATTGSILIQGAGRTNDVPNTISVSSSITAGDGFYGDGSGITGLHHSQVTGVITGLIVKEEGSVVGTAGSVAHLNFVSPNLTVTASGVGATLTLTNDPTFNSLDVTGIATANSFSGSGINLSGIVTSITAGDNISISTATGNVTITGLADTANIRTNSLLVTGISTFNGTGTEIIRVATQSPSASSQEEFGIGFAANVDDTHPSALITWQEFDDSDFRGELAFYTRSLTGDTAPTEKMRITKDGDIGIGTNNPNRRLDVRGSGKVAKFGTVDPSGDKIEISVADAGYPKILQDSSSDTLSLSSRGSIEVAIDSNNNSTGKVFNVVSNGDSGSGTDLLTINEDGNSEFSGIVTATSFSGSGINLSGIVTSITAGDNISISTATGNVTITGLGNTANVSADTLVVTGVSTLGIVTGATYYGDGSNLTGISASDSTVRTVNRYVATQNQTLFPSSGSVSYDVGYVDVYLNGSKLDSTEFTATNGTTVTLTTGASVDDIVELVAFTNVGISTANLLTDTSPQLGGDLDLNSYDITGTGNVNITGIITATSFTGSGVNLTGIPTSVNGQTGTVVLDADDISDDFTTHKFATAAQLAKADDAASIQGSIGQFTDVSISGTPSNGNILQYTSGAFTATTFDIVDDTSPQLGGNLDLNSNDITGTGNINITGNGTFSGNVSIAGTLTYEDVTNVDSVGLITARSGIDALGETTITASSTSALFIKDNSVDSSGLKLYSDSAGLSHINAGYGNLAIETAGSERVRVDSNGRIGIGTNNSTSKLDVLFDTSAGNRHFFTSPTGSGTRLQRRGDTTAWAMEYGFQSNNGTDVGGFGAYGNNTGLNRFYVGSSWQDTKFVIESGGNVGIGTDSAVNKFHVVDQSSTGIRSQSSTIQATDTNKALHVSNGNTTDTFNVSYKGQGYFAGRVGIGTSIPSQLVHINQPAAANFATLRLSNADGVGLNIAARSGSNTSIVSSETGDDLFFGTEGIERIRIDSSGKLGINETSPQTKLHVTASDLSGASYRTTATATFESNGSTELYLVSPNNTKGQIRFGDTDSDYRGAINYRHNTDSLDFVTNGNERVRVTSGGNIGIGLNDPAEKLTVDGTILTVNAPYASNVNVPYLIAATSNYTGATTNWGTRGFQHRVKSNSGGTPRVTIDTASDVEAFSVLNNGRIGIGTDNPQYKLQVEGDIKLADTGTIWFDDTSGTIEKIVGSGSAIDIYADAEVRFFESDAGTEKVSIDVNNARIFFQEDTDTYWYRPAADAHAWTTAGTERFRIDSGGTSTFTGNITVSNTAPLIIFSETDTTSQGRIVESGGDFYIQAGASGSGGSGSGNIRFTGYNAVDIGSLTVKTGGAYNTIWHAGNDGSGSGLDADLLDGLQGSSFLRSDVDDTATSLTIGFGAYGKYESTDTDITGLVSGSTFGALIEGASNGHLVIGIRENDVNDSFSVISGSGNYTTDTTYDKLVFSAKANGTITGDTLLLGGSQITSSSAKLQVNGFMRTGNIVLHEGGNTPTAGADGIISNTSGTLQWEGNQVWTSANDGAGSGLAADTVDGVHVGGLIRSQTSSVLGSMLTLGSQSSNYRWNNTTNGRPADAQSNEFGTLLHLDYDGSRASQFAWDIAEDNLYLRTLTYSTDTGTTWKKVWTDGNDGSGSGLDADTLDGVQGSSFLRSDANDTASGTMTFNGVVNIRSAIDLADNDVLRLGSGDDAELFCNGFHLYLDLNSGIGNFYIRDGTTLRFTFDDNGDFTATGTVSGSSDINLKKNIEVIPNALDKVSKIRGVTFNRIDIEPDRRQSGVIAQEVEKVLPEVVGTTEDGTKTVAYGNMVGLLIEAIKEQKDTIKEQQKQIDYLIIKLEEINK